MEGILSHTLLTRTNRDMPLHCTLVATISAKGFWFLTSLGKSVIIGTLSLHHPATRYPTIACIVSISNQTTSFGWSRSYKRKPWKGLC